MTTGVGALVAFLSQTRGAYAPLSKTKPGRGSRRAFDTLDLPLQIPWRDAISDQRLSAVQADVALGQENMSPEERAFVRIVNGYLVGKDPDRLVRSGLPDDRGGFVCPSRRERDEKHCEHQ